LKQEKKKKKKKKNLAPFYTFSHQLKKNLSHPSDWLTQIKLHVS